MQPVQHLGMGACGHGQEGALAGGTCPPPLEMLYCARVVTAKRLVDDLFTHYFHNLSSASGHGRRSRGRGTGGQVPSPEFGAGDCPPDFVILQNFKHQITCITM